MKHALSREGVYIVDKPCGMSSQRVVRIVKRWAQVTSSSSVKVGHGGTLDPLATGVLVVAVGRAFTKRLNVIVAAEKEYVTTIRLGATSTTDDAEGKKSVRSGVTPPPRLTVDAVVGRFVGDIMQLPPRYSALKINGVPAYKRVRRGQEVRLTPRKVRIAAIDVISYDYPDLVLRVTCGKGTYIRALARDIGAALATGGYVTQLRRTRVGPHHERDAVSVKTFQIRDTAQEKRIGIHTRYLEHARIDGTAVYLHNILRRLPSLMPACTQLCHYHTGDYHPELILPPTCRVRDVRLRALPLWTQTALAAALWRDRCQTVWLPMHTLPLVRRKTLRTVVTIHDLAFKFFPDTFVARDRRMLTMLTDYAVAHADVVIAVSATTKRDILRCYPRRREETVYVVPHGADDTHHRGDHRREDAATRARYGLSAAPYLLHIGAIQPRKNLPLLVDAFGIVKKTLPSSRLVLVGGDGWRADDTHAHIATSPFASDILVTGNIPFADVAALLRGARVCVLPSLYEGFGIPGVEAFAARVPLVAARASCFPEIFGDAALYFDSHDANDAAVAIITACTDEAVRATLCAAGTARVAQLSWDASAAATAKILLA